MVDWREVRGRFFQERDVFLLLGDLPAQPCQLGAFGGRERLVTRCCGGLDPAAFIDDPAAEEGLVDAQFAGDLSDGAAGIDHTLRAASTLYSVVNDLRLRDMRTSFQRNPRSRYVGVHHPGRTSTNDRCLIVEELTKPGTSSVEERVARLC
ncbi:MULTISPECIES: hypothetical protein [unclassified Rhodococcus (in: high G+C Gram-positive bacteria)]|uniref:hypothetical protein n=1 Tax=unclassified Rhodococcus (in: high G+C Gram-positive bacteria) TaxID=192944 RepID=UPI0015C608C1|nr:MULTISPECIES: hypothetical protein [unclassified Rhodococcus (in: high G+C Gram-positive bacteria)]